MASFQDAFRSNGSTWATSPRSTPPPPGVIMDRSAKSALNQIVLQLALMLSERGIIVACGHPGALKSEVNRGVGAFTPEESASHLFKIIDRLTMVDTGQFFEPDGTTLPIVTRQINPNAFGAMPAAGRSNFRSDGQP
ncbi:MAG: hypothetical protein FJX59_07615 [Alphaproteobacteria bacterium]|nr:hypothetical protein [Alphaproteobacteria bacterium]